MSWCARGWIPPRSRVRLGDVDERQSLARQRPRCVRNGLCPPGPAAKVHLDWNDHPEARQEFLDAHKLYLGIDDGSPGDESADEAEAAAELTSWPEAPSQCRGRLRRPDLALRPARTPGCLGPDSATFPVETRPHVDPTSAILGDRQTPRRQQIASCRPG